MAESTGESVRSNTVRITSVDRGWRLGESRYAQGTPTTSHPNVPRESRTIPPSSAPSLARPRNATNKGKIKTRSGANDWDTAQPRPRPPTQAAPNEPVRSARR